MPRYRIANLTVDSRIALPSVPKSRGRHADWSLALRHHPMRRRHQGFYHHAVTPATGARWCSLARLGSAHVVHFWRRASFVISPDTRRITAYPSRATSLDAVRQLFLGHVAPLLFVLDGALSLHASAVHTPRGAVVFAGNTRDGKTTLASALGLRGCPVLADDCAIVEAADARAVVRPLDIGMRLRADALRALKPVTDDAATAGASPQKARVGAACLGVAVRHEPSPLVRVYLLQPTTTGEPRITTLSRADAMVALLGACFPIGVDARREVERTFAMLGTVVAQAPVRRLEYRQGLDRLPALVDLVLHDARH